MAERTRQRPQQTGPGEKEIDTDRAEMIWRTAARLQGEASARLGERSTKLAHKPDVEEALDRTGLAFEEVKEIAVEAGISPEFVDLAIKRLESEEYRDQNVTDKQHAVASAFLGNRERSFEVSRMIQAPVSTVVEAMKRVFPTHPYNLTLIDTIGGNDLEDSVLVFDVPQLSVSGANTNSQFSYKMTVADLNRVFVSIHAVDAETSEVTINVDLKYGKWRNFTVGGGLVTATALFIEFLGLLIGIKKGEVLVGATFGILMFFLMWWGYRVVYNNGVKNGKKELDQLLRVVDANARTGGAFSPPEQSRAATGFFV